MPKACPRAMLFPPTLAARDEGAALPFPTVPCSRRAPSTARLSTARHRLVEAPTCSASPQPAGRERARRAHAQSCSSRATACPSLEYLLWTDPPSPGCVLQASPRGGQLSATPQLPCSLTQRLRSSLQCPARSSRCCHSPPDPCRTLGQPLCARCGGDPPDLWSPLGSFPAAALLPIL